MLSNTKEESAPKFTPGPWTVVAPISPMVGDERMFSVDGPWSDFMFLRNEADANLISAAPEMYEALYNLVSLASPHFSDEPQMLALSLARAALAKALGEKS